MEAWEYFSGQVVLYVQVSGMPKISIDFIIKETLAVGEMA